ncbi:NUMOD4 domain-containing protein [Neobacillus sp. YIM B06451]|uniref:NUMOD4 domain-containing protein n=1 Tax=Neobacillus sp. YIM B06451 TaxID=3070994 RepID=UPI00292CAD11|nr:NUMOD4 domain-containing protein [Neobacillus sp. YIM B06451]
MDIEKWMPIPNYEGIYEVSNFGNVKRLSGDVIRRDGYINKVNEKVLSPSWDDGYKVVSLYKKGQGKRIYVHVLVARAFIPNPEGKPYVNHIDGNRGNANEENLEWVTQSENIKHSVIMTPTEEMVEKRTMIPPEEKEIWSQINIKGFENLYEVSNFGNARSLPRIVEDSSGRKRSTPGKVLKPWITSSGKYMVELSNNKKSRSIYLHRLVAEVFIANPDNKPFVSHIDGFTDNNSVFNLKWETYSEISKLKKDSLNAGEKAPEIKTTEEETWRNIEGYDSHYQVSNLGRVRSLDRKLIGKRGGIKEIKGRLMEIKLKKGYSFVRLSKGGVRRNILVHKLVAQAFISNPDNKPIINHINNIKHDNRLENLEWATYKENTQHMVNQFRGNAKAIKQYDLKGEFIKEYPSVTTASNETGVSYLTIIDMFKRKKNMCAGYLWKWADDDTIIEPYKNPREKEVNQYTLSGEFLRSFPSVLAAAEHLQAIEIKTACRSSISKALLGKVNYAYGFQWRYGGDETPLLQLKNRINRIVQLTLDGELIQMHEHIRAAEKYLGLKLGNSGISKCCNGRQKSAHGFKWMKEEDYINLNQQQESQSYIV